MTESTIELTLNENISEFVKNNAESDVVARMVQLEQRVNELETVQIDIRQRLKTQYDRMQILRGTVRQYFVEELSGPSDIVEMTMLDVNNLLECIDANPIVFTWSCDIAVTARFTGVQAVNEEDAREKVLQAIMLKVKMDELGGEVNYEDEEYEVNNVQEDDVN